MLKRTDDFFTMDIQTLHPSTRHRLDKIWMERGSTTKRGDFAEIDCQDGVCTPKLFVIGDEVLQKEANIGKKEAYGQWWDLYWRAYCTPNRNEKRMLAKQMALLEVIWGKPSMAS